MATCPGMMRLPGSISESLATARNLSGLAGKGDWWEIDERNAVFSSMAGLRFSAMFVPLRNWLFLFALAIIAVAGPSAVAEPPAKRADPALQTRVNAALPRQPQLLQEAINALDPQRPGVRDLYFLGFAGYGDQDVFRKEVERV